MAKTSGAKDESEAINGGEWLFGHFSGLGRYRITGIHEAPEYFLKNSHNSQLSRIKLYGSAVSITHINQTGCVERTAAN